VYDSNQHYYLVIAPNMSAPKYIVITPVRNEQDHFKKTIASMLAQTITPWRWVIVDDGSQDASGYVADRAAAEHAWILVRHRTDRGFRKQGGGVIEAFYDGYSLIEHEPWHYLVKLDGDLQFAGDYFERCLEHFLTDDKLGIGGGIVCCSVNGQIVEESPRDPTFHVRGATKIYRRGTWDEIEGLMRYPGWDTIDEIKANMLGWRTYSFRGQHVLQLKHTGSADGVWRNWVKNGLANYITGYHPLFMLAKCIRRIFRPPIGIGAAGLLYGFMDGYFKRAQQVPDQKLIHYLRKQQLMSMIGRSSLWNRADLDQRSP
jgi:glycosyltransferase involved in cell wall biosynthesis